MNPVLGLRLGIGALILATVAWALWARGELSRLDPIVAKAVQCDEALALPKRSEGLFTIRASCTPPVQREVAARAAAEAGEANARVLLADALAGTTAAVERAEARGLSSTQRRTTADETIRAAPGTADRRHCDARCLRALGG